jgi:hypothetical protein
VSSCDRQAIVAQVVDLTCGCLAASTSLLFALSAVLWNNPDVYVRPEQSELRSVRDEVDAEAARFNDRLTDSLAQVHLFELQRRLCG